MVIFDSLGALLGLGRQGISDAAFASIEDSYKELFERATAAWQRVVFLSGVDAELWHIQDLDRLDHCSSRIRACARTYGIVVLASEDFLSIPEAYRRPGDPWHFACTRANDDGAAQLWQRTTASITMAVKYLPLGNMLAHALGSIPTGGITGEPVAPHERP